jgi:hypothetical protein
MVSQMLARYALPGSHPNMLGTDEREQVAFAYGGNIARLQNVKQHFDPDDIFFRHPAANKGQVSGVKSGSRIGIIGSDAVGGFLV